MVATTDHRRTVSSLCGSAITLVKRGNRTLEQTQKLIDALAQLLGDPAKKIQLRYTTYDYPGTFGNRCRGCGHFIDDGDFCTGGTDHSHHRTQVTSICGIERKVVKTEPEQVEILIHLSSEALNAVKAGHCPEDQVCQLCSALQAFKDNHLINT